MKSRELFTEDAIAAIKFYIEDAMGNEVLFRGLQNEDELIDEVEVGACGNEYSAPAILDFMERGDVVIHNHPGGNLTPSDADLRVASHIGNQGIGFFIIDNEVENVYVVCSPVSPHKTIDLKEDNFAGILEPGGNLSEVKEDYEYRESQSKMLQTILEAYNDNKLAVIEAGTGVGKSLAYLLPSIKWAEKNQERIVISTGTINLQQQLVDKDIPLAMKILGSDLKSILIKGRSNYVCLRRLEDAKDMQMVLFEEDQKELKEIISWAKSTNSGCKTDLNFLPSPSNWSKVCSEADNCLGGKCPVRESCFVMKIRKEASSASILVVNHHLLFSDIAMRSEGAGYKGAAVLPSFSKIVFDEAHNIENNATGFFSKTLNKFTLHKLAGRIYTAKGHQRFGLVKYLKDIDVKKELLETIPPLVSDLKSLTDDFNTALFMNLGESRQFIFDDDSNQEFESIFIMQIQQLGNILLRTFNALNQVLEVIGEEDKDSPACYELTSILSRIQGHLETCKMFEDRSEFPNNVFFIEKKYTSQGDFFIELTAAPIDISRKMQKSINDVFDSIIYTSATITINSSFDYFLSRIGLKGYDEDRLITTSYPSPFPYKKTVLLGIPTDAVEQNSPSYVDYLSATIEKALKISKGSGLVLFTSYSIMTEVYKRIAENIQDAGINVFLQGEDERTRLLNKFNNDISSVLFATDSFWEGVDSPGETLQLVIITKLPFKVPTEPIFKARIKAIEEKKGNAFMQLSVPDAAMKLKQGFGRLVRKKSDYGSVVILDGRIVNKRYGKVFLNSLPDSGRSFRPTEELMENLEIFFETREKFFKKEI
ncbi:MAG: DEAD/DEAH box helicase [Spirochaetales bacterium]|nr:DEAD/DEAH box helicase [Spirochaetales bacterium]